MENLLALTTSMQKCSNADTVTSANILLNLFVTIWEDETLPSDWRKGLIVKLAKKGDLQICDNWRGITLLSVPSKVFFAKYFLAE